MLQYLDGLGKVLWFGVSQLEIQEERAQKNSFSSVQLLRHVQFIPTPWTVAHQAPLSMGFSRQEYSSGLPFPPPGNLPDLGIETQYYCFSIHNLDHSPRLFFLSSFFPLFWPSAILALPVLHIYIISLDLPLFL